MILSVVADFSATMHSTGLAMTEASESGYLML
jgi:hypothetical protein